jgi:hypothetical protein
MLFNRVPFINTRRLPQKLRHGRKYFVAPHAGRLGRRRSFIYLVGDAIYHEIESAVMADVVGKFAVQITRRGSRLSAE